MGKYSDYNIIPMGDHCAIPMALADLGLRTQSYPFDWVTHINQERESNLLYNVQLIRELTSSDTVDDIVKKYIGDAFDNKNRVNSGNQIWFPHEHESVPEILEKYKRRFVRMKSDIDRKNMFILLSRHCYIEKDVFQTVSDQLLKYNRDSVVLFISGKNHTYFEGSDCPHVLFKHINYDMSKFWNYDATFRPSVKQFLSDLLL